MRIAIAGGTGVVGRHLVAAARAAGHDVVVLSRSHGVDLALGTGLPGRLAGVAAVVDVTSTGTLSARRSVRFFEAATRALLRAEREAGTAHHVALSIIGAASAASGYYAGKAAQERIVTGFGDRWSLLRAAQFHEFAAQTAQRGRVGGVHLVPVMRTQPVAAAEVAAALLEIAVGDPRGVDRDLAGPREEDLPDLVRRFLRSTGEPSTVLRVPFPGAMGRAMRDGGLLPGPGARLSTTTFEEWLAAASAGSDARP